MKKDDSGVMMLMTAVILVIGFVALSGMTARTAQIPQEIDSQRGQVFMREIEGVASLVDRTTGPDGILGPCSAATLPVLNQTLNSLRLHLHGKGIAFEWFTSCDLGDSSQYRTAVCLSDGRGEVQMVLGYDLGPAEVPFNCKMLSTAKWTILP